MVNIGLEAVKNNKKKTKKKSKTVNNGQHGPKH